MEGAKVVVDLPIPAFDHLLQRHQIAVVSSILLRGKTFMILGIGLDPAATLCVGDDIAATPSIEARNHVNPKVGECDSDCLPVPADPRSFRVGPLEDALDPLQKRSVKPAIITINGGRWNHGFVLETMSPE